MALYKKASKCLFLFLLSGFLQSALAQNNTNSPYAYSGLGELNQRNLIKNKALSGLSSSVFSNNSFNLVNPASLGFIDKTIIDFGLITQRSTIKAENAVRDYNNGNFDYFSLGFNVLQVKTRMNPDTILNSDKSINIIKPVSNLFSWGTGISITPYSSLGGDFQQEKDTSFANSLLVNTATGGLTSVAFNNGFKVGRFVSIGYSLSFIWGQSIKTRLVTFPDSQNIITLQDLNFTQYFGSEHNIGIGVKVPINKKSIISAGFSQRFSNTLKTKQSRAVRSFDYTLRGDLALLDTILFVDDIKGNLQVPSYTNIGVSYTFKNKFSIGGEYAVQDWSSISDKGWNEDFGKFNRVSLGITINPESKPTLSMRKPEIYFGFNSSNLSAIYRNSTGEIIPVKEVGISFGIGLPIIRDVFTEDGKREKYKSMIYLSGEYTKRGDESKGQIKEDLYRLSLGMSLTDLWFVKRKYR